MYEIKFPFAFLDYWMLMLTSFTVNESLDYIFIIYNGAIMFGGKKTMRYKPIIS